MNCSHVSKMIHISDKYIKVVSLSSLVANILANRLETYCSRAYNQIKGCVGTPLFFFVQRQDEWMRKTIVK